MKVRLNLGTHISEDRLEEYAFARLGEPEIAEIEEHLLVCEGCQESLARVDQFISLMKNGTAAPVPIRTRSHLKRFVIAGSIAAAIAAAFLIASPFGAAPAESVDLVALRGVEMARVHAGNSAEFRIDAADLEDGTYRIELVDGSGHPIWSGPVQASARHIRVAEPKPLSSGQYWVRLYSSQQTLLREFGLQAVR